MSNVGELDRIRGFLRANPALHDQNMWACGTVGCVAGWTDALNRGCRAGDDIGYISSLTRTVDGRWAAAEVIRRARAILGLSDAEARALFHETARHDDDRDEAEALALIDALIARDKGDLTDADRDVLRRYGLTEEPQT